MILKLVNNQENVHTFSIPVDILKKDLLKVKQFMHYVNFHIRCTDFIKKATKHDKLLHQVIKLARQNDFYKLNKRLTFLEYIENRNASKYILKTDSEMTEDDDLKPNRTVIPSDLQNHIVPLAH